jgi:uncharacterized protein YbjT (DUF2867 family)
VFVTGATGYLGVPLIRELLRRGHVVRALVRPGSGAELPPDATRVVGNALDAATYRDQVTPADTLVHLVGTPRPSPAKAAEFRRVDLVSVEAAVGAALHAGIRHFVYLSVAQPAPIMRAYVEVRREGEALIRASGLVATFLRPWYVLGPGHRWPWLLVPLYAVMSIVPSTSDGARRLGLVTRRQMVSALTRAVEEPPEGVRVVEVPEIRAGGAR